MRESIVTSKDQGPGRPKPAPPLPVFVPVPFYRSHYYRDPSSRTFHIFTVGDATALCGVSRTAKGRKRGWTNLTCERLRICRTCLRARAECKGQSPKQGKLKDKVLLKIDRDVLDAIDRRVGRDRRVEWIQTAIRRALATSMALSDGAKGNS